MGEREKERERSGAGYFSISIWRGEMFLIYRCTNNVGMMGQESMRSIDAFLDRGLDREWKTGKKVVVVAGCGLLPAGWMLCRARDGVVLLEK